MTEALANAIVTIICLVVLCLIELAIIWTYAKDNAELRARLADASRNDARDPVTGRYVGR